MQSSFTPIIIPLILIPILLLAYWRLRVKRIASYNSPLLGKIEVLQKYNREKLLTINTYAQGVSIQHPSISKSYWYKIASETVRHCKNTRQPRVLMLGLGANTISNLINKLNPKIHQTIVEFDPFIIQACKDHFRLNELSNYQLIQADAYKILNSRSQIPDSRFDVIIVDIFTGKPPYVDLKSNRPNFIQKVIPLLKSDGMMIFNRPGNTELARSDSLQLESYLKTKFATTEIFDIKDPRGYRNNLIIVQRVS